MIKQLPITECIADKMWYLANECKNDFDSEPIFKLKIMGLNLINKANIDSIEKVSPFLCHQNGDLWLLCLRIINMTPENINDYSVDSVLKLMDQDGYTFSAIYDDHISHNSEFSVETGLYNSYWKKYEPNKEDDIYIIYNLPDEADAKYFITRENGFFCET